VKYSTFLAAALFGGVSFAGAAGAVTVTGTGNGNFSNIQNCSGCSITGGGNVLDMSGGNNSTLTITDTPFNFNPVFGTPVNDGIIGQITWVNRPSTGTDQNFNTDYTFTLTFTAPNGQADSQSFTMNILQPTNPPGDSVLNLTNAGIANLGPFTLNGVTVSDIHFHTDGNDGSAYNGTAWTLPDPSGNDPSNTSNLYITADFTVPPPSVPEPISMSLLGAGLVGLGLIRRKRA
jgi:hypothetical protein